MSKTEEPERAGDEGMLTIRAWVALYGLIAVLFVGIGIGWVVGRLQGSTSVVESLATAEVASEEASGRGLPSAAPSIDSAPKADSLALAYELATRINSLESLLAAAEERQIEPEAMIEAAISQLSDGQIRAGLGPVVRLSEEELSEIEDIPAYAARLAHVAMEGMVESADDDAPSDVASAEVSFARELDRRDPESLAESDFAVDAGRIYAVFEVGDFPGQKVVIKWYRSDGPELLLFRHYRLSPDNDFSWVWLDRKNGWTPGRYRVDVLSGDEAVERIASGRFMIR